MPDLGPAESRLEAADHPGRCRPLGLVDQEDARHSSSSSRAAAARSRSSTRRAVSGCGSYSKRSSGVTRSPRARPTWPRRNVAARASARSAAARASAVSPSVRTYTRATRRSGDMRTAVTVRSRSRGSFARRRKSAASSAWTRWATRSGRRSAIAPSVMEELEALLAQLGELEPVDEAHDFPEAGVHVPLVPPHLAYPQGRALPVIVVGALGDRDVELALHARLDAPEHAALALERVVLGQPQLEPEHADHHRYSSPALALYTSPSRRGAAPVRPSARPPARPWLQRGRAGGPPAPPRRPRSRRLPSCPGTRRATCRTRSRPRPRARPP